MTINDVFLDPMETLNMTEVVVVHVLRLWEPSKHFNHNNLRRCPHRNSHLRLSWDHRQVSYIHVKAKNKQYNHILTYYFIRSVLNSGLPPKPYYNGKTYGIKYIWVSNRKRGARIVFLLFTTILHFFDDNTFKSIIR